MSNDVTLILPIAGRSSRYPGMRPKWMLTHPRGKFMITESIRGLQAENFQRIVIISLRAHEEDFHVSAPLIDELSTTYGVPSHRINVVLFDGETGSQPETVHRGIVEADIRGKILIKDSDNCFDLSPDYDTNFVAAADLGSTGPIEAANKSYVQTVDNEIVRIVEKEVISSRFCCGAYFFLDAAEFSQHYNALSNQEGLYVSHVIQNMLEAGSSFVVCEGHGFQDWGTLADWRAFQAKFSTVFINLDGLIVYQSSQHFEPHWGTTEALRRNAGVVNALFKSGRAEVIVITSRPESVRAMTEGQLRKNGVRYHRLLMGLPHNCKQILVNAFSSEAPYEAAVAVNTRVDEDHLDEMFSGLLD